MISDVQRLRSLREVDQRGTVTAAAESLGYTPSAVSQQISSLEAELGVPVLEKRGRNVALTDAGRLLVEHSADVLGALERAESAIAELHGEPVGVVRIGALPSAAASIIPVALKSARAEHAGLEPQVAVYPLDENLRELRLGTIDLAVEQCYESAPHDQFDNLDETVLLREPMFLVSPSADPRESVADAGNIPWVSAPAVSACGRSTRAIADRAGVSPHFVYETDDHHATTQLVAAGLAVAILPGLALTHGSNDVHRSLIPDVRRKISAVTRPSARARPAITTVIDHLVRAADQFEDDAVA